LNATLEGYKVMTPLILLPLQIMAYTNILTVLLVITLTITVRLIGDLWSWWSYLVFKS